MRLQALGRRVEQEPGLTTPGATESREGEEETQHKGREAREASHQRSQKGDS